MPKYSRGSEINLDEAYGPLLNDNAATLRNIRTGASMTRVHHCGDSECGEVAPKLTCIRKGHLAFCLAPVVDKDAASPTYGEVVIHGERFAVLSPQGCAEHRYTDDFNLDIKDARNGPPDFPIRWKQRFKDAEEEHETDKAKEAEEREATQKLRGMTGHQRQVMHARQDKEQYLRRREVEIVDMIRDVPDVIPVDAAIRGVVQEPAHKLSKAVVREAGELAVQVCSITNDELKRATKPLWLYEKLFKSLDARHKSGGELRDWSAANTIAPVQTELAIPTKEWLHHQLYTDGPGDEEEEEQDKRGRRAPGRNGLDGTTITKEREEKDEETESSQDSSYCTHDVGRGSEERGRGEGAGNGDERTKG
ncbi:hypothetical protein EK21DRAFT_59261 [Setomelanomma holmii]|uniref:Uncharacterized protein n=1 Tax=Setomelanomma holmii TaxID=210430 RepID=A0A9P4HEH4_9PLEO|nr:hypothetical protein EK21DRAFT_59261 [Setomelanomma holmii]